MKRNGRKDISFRSEQNIWSLFSELSLLLGGEVVLDNFGMTFLSECIPRASVYILEIRKKDDFGDGPATIGIIALVQQSSFQEFID